MLQLYEADGAFAHLEEWLRGEGFFAPSGEHLVADLYLGYGLSASLRRTGMPPPPEPCPLPLLACAVRRDRHDVEYDNGGGRSGHGGSPAGDAFEIGAWSRTWQEPDHRAAVDAVRTAIASGDVYQVNLVQHLSAPFAGSPSALAARLAPLTQPNDAPLGRQRPACARGCRLGDRLCLARAPRLTPRTADSDTADQGNAASRPAGRAAGLAEGRCRARHDRRPRAQRPLARLRPRHGAVARVDACGVARRGRAPRLDGRGRAPTRRRSGGDPRGGLPGRVGHGCAEDRRDRPDRGARAGRPRRVDGGARPRLRDRGSRARAHDPDVRGRGGPRPSLGRRRDRLGLRPAGGGGRVAREGGAAARRDRRAAPSGRDRRVALGHAARRAVVGERSSPRRRL